jgi:hypothetical protein
LVRHLIGPTKDDPTIYSDLLQHNLINADDFLHYQESLFIAISLALSSVLSPRELSLVKGFNDQQLAKLILDNAMSAWSYEDLVSNQLGVKFFQLHGAFVNAGADAAEVRQRFIDRVTEFFAAIQVVNNPSEIKRLGASLPGKERWTAPKIDETSARKKFPELFNFGDQTHRVRIAVYDREGVATQKSAEIAKLVPSAGNLHVEPYGKGQFGLYAGPTSHFAAVILKWTIDRAIKIGPGGAVVELYYPVRPR